MARRARPLARRPSPGMCSSSCPPQAPSGLDEASRALSRRRSRRAHRGRRIAASLDQRAALWRLREALSEVQGKEGGSIKHDVSVAVGARAGLHQRGDAAVEALMPGARVPSPSAISATATSTST